MMKSRRTLARCCALALAALMALTGCSNGSSSSTGSAASSVPAAPSGSVASATETGERTEGGTIYLATSDVLGEFFSPYKQGSLATYGWPCYQPLAWQREDGTWDSCLAESWERDDEAFSLTLNLVENATFSDGTPLNADDVLFSLASRAEYGTDSTIGSPVSVEKIDDYTVKVTWDSFSLNYEQWILGEFVYSEDAFKEKGLDWMLNNMIGSGPYVLSSFTPDVSLIYERNENYWGEKAAGPDRIEYLYMPDATTMLAAFMNGEIDRMTVSDPTVYDQLSAAGFAPYTSPTASADGQYLAVPLSVDENDPLYKQEVRQAIFEHGIDWQTMSAGLGGPLGYHTDAIGMTGMSYYDESLEKSSYDPELAKQMLAEAGYPDGFTTTIYTSQPFAGAATMLQAGLAELGITAECEFVDYSLVQSDYIGAKATQNGICVTCLYFPNTPQSDRFTKHINPTATYGSSSTWDDEINALWKAVPTATTVEEENSALQAYVDHYVHTGSWIWPMYNTTSAYFYPEWFGFSEDAFCGNKIDPMEIWTNRR